MILLPCTIGVVSAMCQDWHGYGSCSATCTYAFAVFEESLPVAAFSWQPPPYGAAKAVSPSEPQGALALSRMVAVPKTNRQLKHISKPLKTQMKSLIDRTRYPVLVTYHDEGEGHTGYVYQCSGWVQEGEPSLRPFYVYPDGRRASPYSNGVTGLRGLVIGGYSRRFRWVHRVVSLGEEQEYMALHGWKRIVVTGKTWKSGAQAFRLVRGNGVH